MQKTAPFTKIDLAKHPFLKETTQYVKKLDFKIEDITSPELAQVLKRDARYFLPFVFSLRKPESFA